jgi:hypothetical protein
VDTFIYCIPWREALHSLLVIVFRLVLLRAIVIDLGYVILGADITVVIIAEVLFDSIGAVVKLILVDLTVLYYPGVDNDVSHLRVRKFNYYR